MMLFFEWGGVAVHDIDFRAAQRGEKPWSEVRSELKGISGEGPGADRQGLPGLAGHQRWSLRPGAACVARPDRPAGPVASRPADTSGIRGGPVGFNGTPARPGSARRGEHVSSYAGRRPVGQPNPQHLAHSIIFCGHFFPDQTYTFTEEEVADETRGGWYVRQLVGAANIEGSPLFHIVSGNLGYQVEHHLYPDMPSSRYSEIAPKVKEICQRYQLPYNSGGRFSKQLFSVHRTVFRLSFPGGKPPRPPKPGPYRGESASAPAGPSEANRFRERVPAEHPDAGPEHVSGGGVAVEPPRRGND